MNIVIDYEPTAKGMPRTDLIKGHVITHFSHKTQYALDDIREMIACQHYPQFPPHIPIKLVATFHRTKSKWLPKREKQPFRKPDLDNFLKLCLDCISPLIVPDDAQITSIAARKVWSANGHGYIEIELEEDTP